MEAQQARTEGRTWRELIVMATLRLAIAGNKTALKEIWDRADGKVLTEVRQEITGQEPFVAAIRELGLFQFP